MDRFNREDFSELLRVQDAVCCSIYMPTHRAGRETMQDPIRLRNLLNQAEDRIVEAGLRYGEAREMLEPARRLVNDGDFWRYQSDGLVIFLAKSVGMRRYRVPLQVREMAVIAPHFHATPLLPLLAEAGRFFVLGLSQKKVRLLACTRQQCETVAVPDMPTKYEDITENIEVDNGTFRRQEGGPTGGSIGDMTGNPRQQGMFHAHGMGGKDTDMKTWMPEFCQKINDALVRHLQGETAPLVLAATEPLEAIFRAACTYPHLIEATIKGNTDHMGEAHLQEAAWPVVQPFLAAEREKTVQAYDQLKGTPSASNLLDVVLQAAMEGRVQSLLLAVDSPIWGKYDPESSRIELHSRIEMGDEDLLNIAAALTERNGGRVYGLPRNQMPESKPVAAVFRY